MDKETHKLFVLAAKHFFKKYKAAGGSQKALAKELSVTQPYLSSVINGSRSASLDLLNQLALRLYGPFDTFLAAGRRIENGYDPVEKSKHEGKTNEVETLIAQLTHYVMQQKKIEKQLEISQEKYKDTCFLIGDMVFELDAEMRLSYITGKVEEAYGRKKNKVIGHKPFEFVDNDETEKVKTSMDDAIRNRTIFDIVVCDTRGGRKYYRNVIGKPLFSSATDNFIGIRGVSKDITEKKEMQTALDEQMWLFQSAIDSITEMAVVITDKESRVVKWNAAYLEMFGYPTEILETRNISKYFSYLKENNLLVNYDDFLKGIAETQNSTNEKVHEFSLKDGRTIRRRSKPIYRDGEFAGRVNFLQDITKDKRKTDRKERKKK
jgi:PAS domain S-box-containing protein